ncbi:MAG: PCRF domain-containing protein, partial [SAR324 cluster bacterium]|nr:PCRF domain-containing protein [SAR324 cluster bacterium]
MWQKLEEVEKRFEEVSFKLTQPDIIGNRDLLQKYTKEHKDLQEIVATYRAYKKASEELLGTKELLESGDPEMSSMAKDEIRFLEQEIHGLEKCLQVLLLPKDPNDDKNIILEIRAGAG